MVLASLAAALLAVMLALPATRSLRRILTFSYPEEYVVFLGNVFRKAFHRNFKPTFTQLSRLSKGKFFTLALRMRETLTICSW